MGEVYEAWDERLERRVALKRLRSDGPEGADPQGRERLRREARSAARLSHPSIVQVHDLMETVDGDWIVLERVEGKTLAALLRDGPLDLAPASLISALNLADAEYLQGRKAEAEALYRKVLDLVAQDPAPTFWQNLTIRAQALAHLGQREEAVAAIQQALRAAPDNPQVAYEASLVYTVVGDVASARINADRALAAGFDRRWFTFPWFASLGGSTSRRRAAG
jgi:tetratricopeptide (TPR) repeat protein